MDPPLAVDFLIVDSSLTHLILPSFGRGRSTSDRQRDCVLVPTGLRLKEHVMDHRMCVAERTRNSFQCVLRRTRNLRGQHLPGHGAGRGGHGGACNNT